MEKLTIFTWMKGNERVFDTFHNVWNQTREFGPYCLDDRYDFTLSEEDVESLVEEYLADQDKSKVRRYYNSFERELIADELCAKSREAVIKAWVVEKIEEVKQKYQVE